MSRLEISECGVKLNSNLCSLVLAIAVADTVDEAVELANNSEYTLVSSLWTTNVYSAFEVAGRIRAGEVFDQVYFTVISPHLTSLRAHFYHFLGFVNINGPTMNSEAGEGHAGLGYVGPHNTQSPFSTLNLTSLTFRFGVIQRYQRLREVQRGELYRSTVYSLARRAQIVPFHGPHMSLFGIIPYLDEVFGQPQTMYKRSRFNMYMHEVPAGECITVGYMRVYVQCVLKADEEGDDHQK